MESSSPIDGSEVESPRRMRQTRDPSPNDSRANVCASPFCQEEAKHSLAAWQRSGRLPSVLDDQFSHSRAPHTPKPETVERRDIGSQTPTPLAQSDLEPLLCLASFHPRDTQSKISVWESSRNSITSKTFGTLIVRSSQDQVQTSTFKCSINLIVEVDMCSQDLELRAVERGSKRPKFDDRVATEGGSKDQLVPRKRRKAGSEHQSRRSGRRQGSASAGDESTKSTSVPNREEEHSPPLAPSSERDRRGRKSLQGGSARDSFTAEEQERLRDADWPVQKRSKDGLPAVWCPRCFLDRNEFLHLQVTTRVTTKGEPRIDLRHAKCAKGFAADIFPKSILRQYLDRAVERKG